MLGEVAEVARYGLIVDHPALSIGLGLAERDEVFIRQLLVAEALARAVYKNGACIRKPVRHPLLLLRDACVRSGAGGSHEVARRICEIGNIGTHHLGHLVATTVVEPVGRCDTGDGAGVVFFLHLDIGIHAAQRQ